MRYYIEWKYGKFYSPRWGYNVPQDFYLSEIRSWEKNFPQWYERYVSEEARTMYQLLK